MTSTLPPLIQAFSGAIGSATANTVTYPLDLTCTRLQTSRSKHIRGFTGAYLILRKIIQKHGWSALYDGLETDTGATLLSNFFYFYFYSFLRSQLTSRRSTSNSKITMLSVPEELSLGFIAGLASRAISMPLSLVTTRLQTERESAEDGLGEDEMRTGVGFGSDESIEKLKKAAGKKTGVAKVVKSIYKETGLTGFWRGFPTTILLSLNPALTLFLFQLFRRIALRGSTPKPGQAFIGAAVSNSIAVTVLYPLILAKTRLQSSAPSSSPSGSSHPAQNMITVLQSAYSKQGILGLYQGLQAQILKGFLSEGVTLMVKSRIEQLVVRAYLRRQAAER